MGGVYLKYFNNFKILNFYYYVKLEGTIFMKNEKKIFLLR